ncbi:sugar phosphate isomerase/epimerase family protein [Mucilaginibacter sp. OK098]|uniref:sugar phosphate isomerase/epimerase family protein n=1 Tax=Mucilaginibacter sp. OK098 TaxID=1855297 RepID=UPI0009194C3E|nr:TIM barrel protein [Mucilaginibacter sp. OK098]SHL92632.1 Tat (twin-arginine translocation) pathway signal sequence [Mucilaginibacter sp. OK098]
MKINRRHFVKQAAVGATGLGLAAALPGSLFADTSKELFFKISISQFSFASQFWTQKLNPLDFAAKAKELGISGLDYCSMFFADKARDQQFLNDLKKRSADAGSYNLRIMVDGEGVLGDLNEAVRLKAVEGHYKWIDAAATLGCPMIRVNVEGEGAPADVAKAAVDSLGKLIEYGSKQHIDVIVENHVGISCNAAWLAGVMKQVNSKHCGTLADFGNFCINRTKPETNDIAGYMKTKCLEEYDKYKGITELMPFAKGVHAKSHFFTTAGDDAETDFYKMFKIIKDSGFNGWVSIEYEGGLLKMYSQDAKYLDDYAGVTATKNLVEKAGRMA